MLDFVLYMVFSILETSAMFYLALRFLKLMFIRWKLYLLATLWHLSLCSP